MITAIAIWLLVGLLCLLVVVHNEDLSGREMLTCAAVCLILSPVIAVFTIEYLFGSWREE